ncbi:MAG: hypothetical protein ACYCZX_00265 [Rhodospirillaceae bacterium]
MKTVKQSPASRTQQWPPPFRTGFVLFDCGIAGNCRKFLQKTITERFPPVASQKKFSGGGNNIAYRQSLSGGVGVHARFPCDPIRDIRAFCYAEFPGTSDMRIDFPRAKRA